MLLYSNWLGLSLTTRNQLATLLGIAKTGPTHVQDNRVVSDGFNVGDVERALSVENMQKVLDSKEKDFVVLWELLVATAEGRTSTSSEEIKLEGAEETGKVEIIAPKETSTPKKRGRKPRAK